MTSKKDLSVIIVNWNTCDFLAQCLESVPGGQLSETGLGQHVEVGTRNLDIEVIVVDNASSDGSAEMVRRRFPQVKLIENSRNIGFAMANNQAIAYSRGRYVLLLNSDTVVHSGALQRMVAFMEDHSRAGAVGPRLLNEDGTLQPSVHPMMTPAREFWRLIFLEKLWPLARYQQEQWDTETPRLVDVIKGACLMVRRRALEQTGLLDDRYFMYTEEVDLCYRLARDGWNLCYVPAAVVTHFGEASSRQMAEDMYIQLYRSKLQFFRKFGGAGRARRFKVLVSLAYAPRAMVATTSGLISEPWRTRGKTYRRLLRELD
ncbi:MAG: glycosyltransferase family 2 protein [Chloroflexota bacterium]|nr:glycosyltransferase family 2 protein [Chloroflexota bacterium]